MRTAKVIAVWALQVLVGALFITVGVRKFGNPMWIRMFARWGYPDGFYIVVGVLEVIGGLALLIPRTAAYGALLMIVVMAGAVLTHLAHGETQRFMVPMVYLVLAGIVGWLRRRPVRGDITVAS